MVRTSYLRVYVPIEALGDANSGTWNDDSRADLEAKQSRRWLVSAALPEAETFSEGAFLRKVGDRVFACPWRTRLRMLAGLLAFRSSLPEEVADAFVSEAEARRAARELEELGHSHPEVRSHIIHANWHVPLRWFAAFLDDQRILTEDRDGLRIRYETPLDGAMSRLTESLQILDTAGFSDEITDAVRELISWLELFSGEGILELDYGSVASMFSDEELLDDHSAAEVWTCLGALERGDLAEAGEVFGTLTERWNEVRSNEVLN